MGATPASRRLDVALAACREADSELVAASVHLLALQAHAAHPEASEVRLWWSDQGDFLDVHSLTGADGEEIEWDDHDSVAWNLEGHGEGHWQPFVLGDDDAARGQFYRLPIQATLDHFDQLPQTNREAGPR